MEPQTSRRAFLLDLLLSELGLFARPVANTVSATRRFSELHVAQFYLHPVPGMVNVPLLTTS